MMASPSDGVPPESWEEMAADLEARLIIQQPPSNSNSNSKSSSSSLGVGVGVGVGVGLGFVDDDEDDDLKTIPTSIPSSSNSPSSIMVDQFLREALQKPRERLSILRMENDILNFIRDPRQQHLEFEAPPTSYLRLAAHRVAQHYSLHSLAVPDPNPNPNPDGSSSSRILLTKNTSTQCRLPPFRLADIPLNLPTNQGDNNNNVVVKVAAIKQRSQTHSHSHFGTTTNNPSTVNLLKTVEERKQEYNRARARIFSSGSNTTTTTSSTTPSPLPANSQHHFDSTPSIPQTQHKPVNESESESELHPHPNLGARQSQQSNTTRSLRVDTRDKGNNKVAILRDREVERKDPDYDRSYDRYMQRFDPGFGFNGGGTYAIPAMYTPVLNYNTEFPQLGEVSPGHRPCLTIEHQPRQMSPHMHSSWVPASSPTSAHGYGPPEAMIPPFNSNHVSIHSAPGMYLHSPQYLTSPHLHPGMAFLHPRDQLQSFPQSQQQQPEGSFGLARPR